MRWSTLTRMSFGRLAIASLANVARSFFASQVKTPAPHSSQGPAQIVDNLVGQALALTGPVHLADGALTRGLKERRHGCTQQSRPRGSEPEHRESDHGLNVRKTLYVIVRSRTKIPSRSGSGCGVKIL